MKLSLCFLFLCISVPNFTNRVFIFVCYFGPRVLNEPYITCSSFFHLLHLLLPCLFVTSVGVFKNELITWMYCWLVLFCYFFQFSSLAIECLFAFIIPAGVFLERAMHACIICWSRPKFFSFLFSACRDFLNELFFFF